MDIEDRFAAVESEYLQFDRVANKKSMRSDVNAWMLLDELFPDSKHCMMDQVTSDEVYLSIPGSQISKLTDAQILELTRSGVMYSMQYESLYMFA